MIDHIKTHFSNVFSYRVLSLTTIVSVSFPSDFFFLPQIPLWVHVSVLLFCNCYCSLSLEKLINLFHFFNTLQFPFFLSACLRLTGRLIRCKFSCVLQFYIFFSVFKNGFFIYAKFCFFDDLGYDFVCFNDLGLVYFIVYGSICVVSLWMCENILMGMLGFFSLCKLKGFLFLFFYLDWMKLLHLVVEMFVSCIRVVDIDVYVIYLMLRSKLWFSELTLIL